MEGEKKTRKSGKYSTPEKCDNNNQERGSLAVQSEKKQNPGCLAPPIKTVEKGVPAKSIPTTEGGK